MSSLSEHMTLDHGRCDRLFSEAEAAAMAGQWRDCAERTGAFASAMRHHFSLEEETLFPAFEARTGMTAGPTRVMRQEHDQMRQLLGELEHAAEHADQPAFEDLAETLLILMQQHNIKEETILYPMCEQAIGEDSGVRAGLMALNGETAS